MVSSAIAFVLARLYCISPKMGGLTMGKKSTGTKTKVAAGVPGSSGARTATVPVAGAAGGRTGTATAAGEGVVGRGSPAGARGRTVSPDRNRVAPTTTAKGELTKTGSDIVWALLKECCF